MSDQVLGIPTEDEPPLRTTCCVVGGGPAGVVLSLILARNGIPTVLLEAAHDFDRDFRGDTVHPPTMELFERLGLVDQVLKLPHDKVSTFTLPGHKEGENSISFDRLKTRYPYVTMMSQAVLLDFLAKEAQRSPCFTLIMHANVQELIFDHDRVAGVRYKKDGHSHEVRATLTVGADGRSSRVRRSAGIEPVKLSDGIDVLWFRLPRHDDEAHGIMGRAGSGRLLIFLNRGHQWQIGYIFPKGNFNHLREEGIEAFRESLVRIEPALADRVHLLHDWKDVALLNVESNRVPQWYRDGLLLIGDAAHAMSPIGGVGINYAVQDAVAAANALVEPLRHGKAPLEALAAVQKEREWPTKVMQAIQAAMQRQLVKRGLDSSRPFRPPFFLRWPLIRRIPPWLISYGVRTTRLKVDPH